MSEITVHCLLRNEEKFVRQAIMSVLPIAQRVLVYDTGSTDATLDVVSSIDSDKIEIVQKKSSGSRDLTEYRNEMIEQTTTEWFMLVDGDEIYPADSVRRIVDEMERIPQNIHRIVVHRRHFVGSFNLISPVDGLGRIFRTSRIRIRKDYPYQTSCLRDNPSTPFNKFSMQFPEDIFFFHCNYLVRSSKDAELGRFRGWRKPPFPVHPYLGPWPETLELNGIAHRMTSKLFCAWMGMNARVLWLRRFRLI